MSAGKPKGIDDLLTTEAEARIQWRQHPTQKPHDRHPGRWDPIVVENPWHGSGSEPLWTVAGYCVRLDSDGELAAEEGPCFAQDVEKRYRWAPLSEVFRAYAEEAADQERRRCLEIAEKVGTAARVDSAWANGWRGCREAILAEMKATG